MASRKRHFLKIVLLGDSGVGKTSLFVRYLKNSFSENFKATIGADFLTKDLEVGGRQVTVQVWDTAGQEKFSGLGTSYFRGSDACILVYDVTNEKSFESLGRWKEAFVIQANVEKTADFPFMVLGNKVDCPESERTVPLKTAERWCESVKVPHMEVSAKLGQNVEEAFQKLTARAMENVTTEVILNNLGEDDPLKVPPSQGGNCQC